MLIHGNCLEILHTLDPVGAVICDPPYNISNENIISRSSQGKYSTSSADLTSDYGEWDHFEDEDAYGLFTTQWLLACANLLEPGGFLVSFFDKRRLSMIPDILEPVGMRMRDVLTWVKKNPVPQVRKVKFAQATEMAVVMSKEGPNKFQWQNGYHPNYKRAPIVGGHQRLKDEDGKTLHPTQKPEVIMRWLVDYYSAPEDVVLDPFMGTGTTIVAAIQGGRGYIGIESNEKYYNAAVLRIETVQPDLLPVDYKAKEYKEKWL